MKGTCISIKEKKSDDQLSISDPRGCRRYRVNQLCPWSLRKNGESATRSDHGSDPPYWSGQCTDTDAVEWWGRSWLYDRSTMACGVNPNHKEINVEAALADPDSISIPIKPGGLEKRASLACDGWLWIGGRSRQGFCLQAAEGVQAYPSSLSISQVKSKTYHLSMELKRFYSNTKVGAGPESSKLAPWDAFCVKLAQWSKMKKN